MIEETFSSQYSFDSVENDYAIAVSSHELIKPELKN